MTPFTLHPAFYNQPIPLTSDEKAAPREVLLDFFQNCPFSEIRRLLWQSVEAALALPHSAFDEAAERQSLLWFYRSVEEVLEAAYLLSREQNAVKK